MNGESIRVRNEETVRNDLLAAWLDDAAAGRTRDLAGYQAMFPGHAALVAAEYALLDGPDEPTVAGGAPEIPGVELLERIGRGGQGVVYRGRQEYLDREVAVKVLSTPAFADDFAARFRYEAKTLAALRHPHIVACHQAGVTRDGRAYMVMEFVAGPNLRQWIGAHGALPVDRALRLGRDIARALEHGHEAGIIHRDVKPENVLLQPVPDAAGEFPFAAKLADLGLARAARPATGAPDLTQLTPVGAVVGSPRTMAPEQFDAPEDVDFRADVYGLGCVLFHAMAGKPAFAAGSLTQAVQEKLASRLPDLRDAVPGIAPGVAALVRSMIAADPAARPASHAAVAEACEALLGAEPARRRRGVLPVLVLAVVVSLLLAWDPLGVFHAPRVWAAPVQEATEGETVRLRADGDTGLRYSWREVSGHGVALRDAARQVASFVAPPGLATTYRFEARADNGWREQRLTVEVRVAAAAGLEPLAAGRSEVLLGPETTRPASLGWEQAPQGTWGKDDPDDPFLCGTCGDDTTWLRRRLRHGPFRLRGEVAPDVILDRRPARVAVALLASPGCLVELVLRPAAQGFAAAVETRVAAGDAHVVGEPVSGGFDRARRLGFVIQWDGAALELRFGPAGAETDWAVRRLDAAQRGTGFPPYRLGLEVEGGRGLFAGVVVEALDR